MNFEQQLKRMQRFLRDPDEKIWDRDLIMSLFNDVQYETQQRVGPLDNITVIRIPPLYQWSVMYDWEQAHVPVDASQRQCLRQHAQSGDVYCYRWEAQQMFQIAGDVADEGTQFTHLWEAWMAADGDPGQEVPFPFPADFYKTKFLSWNQRESLAYEDRNMIMAHDNAYVNRQGEPVAYYRNGSVHKTFVPYPRPSSIVWNDIANNPPDYEVLYLYDWESTHAADLNSNNAQWGISDSATSRQITFIWEDGSERNDMIRAMWLFERDFVPDGYGGIVTVSTDTVSQEDGIIIRRDGSLASSELGLTVDVLDEADNFLLIYETEPTEITDGTDESTYPPFLQKYIEQGTIARAYGANTDGRIRSLADYWNYRYQIGIEVIKRYKISRRTKRQYQLRTQDVRPMTTRRHPKLPSSYPAT